MPPLADADVCPCALQPSKCEFEMQQGVVRVWSDASRTTEIGQLPGNDYDFFSDMQRCA